MDGKFYFSNQDIDNAIWDASPWMTFFFVPNKLWSVSAWKMAIDLRKNFYLTGIVKKEGQV